MHRARRSSRANRRLVLSCEHASNRVPSDLAHLFRGERAILATHRGWDIGALGVAQALAHTLAAPLVAGEATRLLVDLNRSPGNRSLLSRMSRTLAPAAREALVARLHTPHWRRVAAMIDAAAAASPDLPVVHVAVHSFTPVLGDDVRDFEVGLLYDPGRPLESAFMDALRAAVTRRDPTLRIRRNAPYRGTSDALPTAFRKQRPAARYLGLELELNQATLTGRGAARRWLAVLAPALTEALDASGALRVGRRSHPQ